MAELRWNPMIDEWTMITSHRQNRPQMPKDFCPFFPKYGKEPVSNATIGAIMDDDGNLVVLSSVLEVLRNLSPEDFAEYAPPAGVPTYLEYAKQAVFGK